MRRSLPVRHLVHTEPAVPSWCTRQKERASMREATHTRGGGGLASRRHHTNLVTRGGGGVEEGMLWIELVCRYLSVARGHTPTLVCQQPPLRRRRMGTTKQTKNSTNSHPRDRTGGPRSKEKRKKEKVYGGDGGGRGGRNLREGGSSCRVM